MAWKATGKRATSYKSRQQSDRHPRQEIPAAHESKEGYAMNVWRRTLDVSDVFHADMPFGEKRDAMVARVRALDPMGFDHDLQDIADGLADARGGNEWDAPWNDFYDWADRNRVWVDTFGRAVTR